MLTGFFFSADPFSWTQTAAAFLSTDGYDYAGGHESAFWFLDYEYCLTKHCGKGLTILAFRRLMMALLL